MAKFVRILGREVDTRMAEVVEARRFFAKKPPWPEGVVQCGECLTFHFQSMGALFPLVEGHWIITRPNESRSTMNDVCFVCDYIPLRENQNGQE